MDREQQGRVARARGEASRQGLTLHELPNGHWEISSLTGIQTLLSAGRLRLSDGREVDRELTLDQLEDLLKPRP